MAGSTVLDAIMPEYKKIEDAPSYEDLQQLARLKRLPLRDIMLQEWSVRYKAVLHEDSKNIPTEIYLVQNPALMTYQMGLGYRSIKRIPPKIIYRGKEITQILKQKRAGAWMDDGDPTHW